MVRGMFLCYYISMSKKKIILIVGLSLLVFALVALAVAFALKKRGSDDRPPSISEIIKPKKSDALPTIYNLGINVEPYNPATGKAGDLTFKDLGVSYESMIFQHFGYTMKPNENNPIPKLNVHPEYFMPRGSKIFAVSDGVVSDAPVIYSGDYSILVTPDDAPEWTLNYEHVVKPTVKKGDRVKVGQIIAEVSTNQMNDNGFGKWALMIFKPTSDGILALCPYTLFHDSVKAEMQGKITRFVKDWESFTGRNIYDEEKWFAPGCTYEKMTEAEAMAGKAPK